MMFGNAAMTFQIYVLSIAALLSILNYKGKHSFVHKKGAIYATYTGDVRYYNICEHFIVYLLSLHYFQPDLHCFITLFLNENVGALTVQVITKGSLHSITPLFLVFIDSKVYFYLFNITWIRREKKIEKKCTDVI